MHAVFVGADFPKVTQSIVGQTKVSAGSSVGFQQPVCLCQSDLATSHPNFPKTLGFNGRTFSDRANLRGRRNLREKTRLER